MLTACITTNLHAGDIGKEPFGARLFFSKDKILVFPDSSARAAASAYPLASSPNPAADDLLRTGPGIYKGYLLPIANAIFFDNGAAATGEAILGATRLQDAGTITVAAIRVDSYEGETNQNDHHDIESNDLILGYSHKSAEHLSWGMELHLTEAQLQTKDTISGASRRIDVDILGAGINAGVLMALSTTFFVGLHGGIKWDHNEIDGVVNTTTPIQFKFDDTAVFTKVRGGIGWQPNEKFGFYSDLEYLRVADEASTTELGRGYMGMDYVVSKAMILRAGAIVDTQPEWSITTGIGYYGIEKVAIEFAYVYNNFPELKREFGRSHFINTSIIFLF